MTTAHNQIADALHDAGYRILREDTIKADDGPHRLRRITHWNRGADILLVETIYHKRDERYEYVEVFGALSSTNLTADTIKAIQQRK